MRSRYTIPKLCKNTKYWYIHYRFDGKQFRETFGLNSIKDLKKREKEYKIHCASLLLELEKGWNPNVSNEANIQSELYIIEALKYSFDKKKLTLADRTKTDYECTIRFVENAVKELKIETIKIVDLKKAHIKLIFDKIRVTRNWSNKSVNKNLGYFKSLLSELVEWEILENNPAHGIKLLKVGETIANVPATDEESKKIKEKLLRDFPSFYVYMITIFHTGIRPKELLDIKLNMVNLNNNEIILPPEITKTDIARIVPINPFLKAYFEEMDIESYNQDFYLFGSNREHSNRGLKKELDFVPGPRRLNRDAASKLWRNLVKDDKKGLGFNVNLYSMKHLGANKKILAGVELDALRELYGHTSKMMTLRYAKIVKEVNRKQILEKSPDF